MFPQQKVEEWIVKYLLQNNNLYFTNFYMGKLTRSSERTVARALASMINRNIILVSTVSRKLHSGWYNRRIISKGDKIGISES